MEKDIVLQFVDAINAHDTGRLYDLMSPDHAFIDAHENQLTGRDKMKVGWAGYFSMFPNYHIQVNDVFADGNQVALFGIASGNYSGPVFDDKANHWRLPAAWKATVENDLVTIWQVYADTKMPFDVMAASNSHKG